MFIPVYPPVILGLAIGDALGAHLEMKSWMAPEFDAWDGRYQPALYHGCAAGEATDDAGMAMALATSLVRSQGFLPEDAAAAYLDWFRTGPKGTGGTIREAMRRLEAGQPWSEAGVVGSTGTGTVMRCAPLGVIYAGDSEKAGEMARSDAQLTHKSQDAEDSSALVATMIALILEFKGRKFHMAIARYALIKAKMRLPDGNLKTQLDNFITHLIEVDRQRDDGQTISASSILGPELHPGGAVETTVIAVGALLLTDNFADCLNAAIRAGGDTDTQAAIAGALAGALYGREGIPDWMAEGLLNSGDYIKADDAVGAQNLVWFNR